MKTNNSSLYPISTLGLLLTLLSSPLQAATVSFSDPSPNGISYEWTVQMNLLDTASVTRHVGAFSWNEPNNPPGEKGWTHTSDWIALELTQPSLLILQVERTPNVPTTGTNVAGDTLYPAFTLFAGWQLNGSEEHVYNNMGNIAWANEISYLDHEENSGNAPSVLRQFILPSGLYSIAVGGNPPPGSTVRREGYTVILNTQSVPESTPYGMLMGMALLGLGSGFYRRLF